MPWKAHPEPAVARAMRAVRRELFLPPDERAHAARDAPLPIGHGQTISQPSLVATMTEELELTPASRVLEIGTGSGFQTAILAEIAAQVFTIERVPGLAEEAQGRLGALGYRNIEFRLGDGALGWPEAAPFDAIIATAAAADLPPAWTEQLAPGGRLVAPVGPAHGEQVLVRVDRQADGSARPRVLFGVRFVPLVRERTPAPPGGPARM